MKLLIEVRSFGAGRFCSGVHGAQAEFPKTENLRGSQEATRSPQLTQQQLTGTGLGQEKRWPTSPPSVTEALRGHWRPEVLPLAWAKRPWFNCQALVQQFVWQGMQEECWVGGNGIHLGESHGVYKLYTHHDQRSYLGRALVGTCCCSGVWGIPWSAREAETTGMAPCLPWDRHNRQIGHTIQRIPYPLSTWVNTGT